LSFCCVALLYGITKGINKKSLPKQLLCYGGEDNLSYGFERLFFNFA